MIRNRWRLDVLGILAGMLVLGCGGGGESSSRSGAGSDGISTRSEASPQAADRESDRWSDGILSWVLPDGWTQGAGGGMRYATIFTGEVEISVLGLGSTGGGVLPNINRWRQQIDLPPTRPPCTGSDGSRSA